MVNLPPASPGQDLMSSEQGARCQVSGVTAGGGDLQEQEHVSSPHEAQGPQGDLPGGQVLQAPGIMV